MSKVDRATLYAIIDEFYGYPCLAAGVDELINPQMGVISSFEDILSSINEIKACNIDAYTPF